MGGPGESERSLGPAVSLDHRGRGAPAAFSSSTSKNRD